MKLTSSSTAKVNYEENAIERGQMGHCKKDQALHALRIEPKLLTPVHWTNERKDMETSTLHVFQVNTAPLTGAS